MYTLCIKCKKERSNNLNINISKTIITKFTTNKKKKTIIMFFQEHNQTLLASFHY